MKPNPLPRYNRKATCADVLIFVGTLLAIAAMVGLINWMLEMLRV